MNKPRYKGVFWDIDGTLLWEYENTIIVNSEILLLFDPETRNKAPPTNLKTITPYDGIEELMKQIPKESQGIISNGKESIQLNKLHLLGLLDYINTDLIFTSYGECEKILQNTDLPNIPAFLNDKKQIYKHGVKDMETLRRNPGRAIEQLLDITRKPNPYMFRLALDKTNLKPEECVMIGNSLISDINGAMNMGMNCIYILPENISLYDLKRTISKYPNVPMVDMNRIESLYDLIF